MTFCSMILSRAASCSRVQSSARVKAVDSFVAAVAGAELIVSAVTASSSGDVGVAGGQASAAAGQLFLDINSVSPAKKQSSCRAVEASGADYVESAVMAPVPPYRLKVPMLLGGQRARRSGRTTHAARAQCARPSRATSAWRRR